MRHWRKVLVGFVFLTALGFAGYRRVGANGTQEPQDRNDNQESTHNGFDRVIQQNVRQMVKEGKQLFVLTPSVTKPLGDRCLATVEAPVRGIGRGVSPMTALAVGLS
jgi:hypothetical protein